MPDQPYQVLGVRPVVMRGRTRLIEKLERHLTKPTPDHLSIIGPRLIGKTVLLRHLAARLAAQGHHYLTAVYWDLRHGTPDCDAAFKRCMAEELRKALAAVRADLAEELQPENGDLGELLDAVFSILQDEGQRVLLVCDGFDRVLAGATITRNLWDYLRDLAHYNSLRLVTGSQKRLQDLCKTRESQTSDFWEIFYDTPIKVGTFGEEDWDDILKPFAAREISLDGSARKELVNWTGGVPLLTAAVLARLYENGTEGAVISKPAVDQTAERVVEECRDHLAQLWDDCTEEMRTDLAELCEKPLPLSEVPDSRQRELRGRGFAVASGSQLKSSCRIMEHYARSQSGKVHNMRRLFGDPQRFDENIRSLLEIRLSQAPKFDPQLLNYVERAIRDLHPYPQDAIVWMRRIAEHALDLIWEKELAADLTIPQRWLEEWKFAGAKYRDMDRGILPAGRGTQCFVLRLMTGTKMGEKIVRPVAKFTSKPTQLLVDHLQSVGDFGQHINNNAVTLRFAASVCLTAIELCESMARDFK